MSNYFQVGDRVRNITPGWDVPLGHLGYITMAGQEAFEGLWISVGMPDMIRKARKPDFQIVGVGWDASEEFNWIADSYVSADELEAVHDEQYGE